MSGPRKLWKTTIVVWSEFDPQGISPVKLISHPDVYWHGSDSELISGPYKQDDGPDEDFFDKDPIPDRDAILKEALEKAQGHESIAKAMADGIKSALDGDFDRVPRK